MNSNSPRERSLQSSTPNFQNFTPIIDTPRSQKGIEPSKIFKMNTLNIFQNSPLKHKNSRNLKSSKNMICDSPYYTADKETTQQSSLSSKSSFYYTKFIQSCENKENKETSTKEEDLEYLKKTIQYRKLILENDVVMENIQKIPKLSKYASKNFHTLEDLMILRDKISFREIQSPSVSRKVSNTIFKKTDLIIPAITPLSNTQKGAKFKEKNLDSEQKKALKVVYKNSQDLNNLKNDLENEKDKDLGEYQSKIV
jgi:hypothetical protein